MRATPQGSLPIHAFAVTDTDDQHDQSVIMDLIENSIGTDANAKGRPPGELPAARRAGIGCQSANRVNDAGPGFTVELGQLLLRSTQNLDHVRHSPYSALISRTACSKGTES
jgi:hypothetical protein